MPGHAVGGSSGEMEGGAEAVAEEIGEAGEVAVGGTVFQGDPGQGALDGADAGLVGDAGFDGEDLGDEFTALKIGGMTLATAGLVNEEGLEGLEAGQERAGKVGGAVGHGLWS